MKLEEATFRNESKVDIPERLASRLTSVAHAVAKQLRAQGDTQASLKDSVVLLALFSNDTERFSILPKVELRTTLKNLSKELGTLSEDEAKPELPRESLIQRCLGPSPNNAVRVLWMANGYNGTLQIHLDEPGTGSKLRLNDRQPLLHGTDGLLSWLGDRTPAQGMAALKEEEADIVKRLNNLRHERKQVEEERLTLVTQKLLESLKGYPPEEAKKVLEKIHQENADLIELRDAIAKDEEERDRIDVELAQILPGFREKWEDVRQRARKAPVPPGGQSAINAETLLMAASYVFDPVYSFATDLAPGRVNELISSLIGYYAGRAPEVLKLLEKMNGVLRGKPYSGDLQDFGHAWLAAGFPKLEVGHKLAASLAMTDVPEDIEVLAPWKAWSLIIPTGLFTPDNGDAENYARVWCLGAEPAFIVLNNGEIFGPLTRSICQDLFIKKAREEGHAGVGVEELWHLLDSLIRGACLALSNPDEYKRQPLKEKAAGVKKPKRETDVPDFSVSRFMLSAPVQIDVRQHLLDYLRGKRKAGGGGGPLTVQHFVRGHWRNQAYGPRLSLRKTIRIEGFWKGPEEGRVLLRNYKVKDEAPQVAPQDTEAIQAQGSRE